MSQSGWPAQSMDSTVLKHDHGKHHENQKRKGSEPAVRSRKSSGLLQPLEETHWYTFLTFMKTAVRRVCPRLPFQCFSFFYFFFFMSVQWGAVQHVELFYSYLIFNVMWKYWVLLSWFWLSLIKSDSVRWHCIHNFHLSSQTEGACNAISALQLFSPSLYLSISVLVCQRNCTKHCFSLPG